MHPQTRVQTAEQLYRHRRNMSSGTVRERSRQLPSLRDARDEGIDREAVLVIIWGVISRGHSEVLITSVRRTLEGGVEVLERNDPFDDVFSLVPRISISMRAAWTVVYPPGRDAVLAPQRPLAA